MGNNKNSQKKDNKTNDVATYNDQLGENASEEFKSEGYSNALTNKDNKKNMK